MTNNETPSLDFIEYRCALVCLNLNDTSKGTGKYGINPATDEQKNLVFGVARFEPLFTKGINNVRFELYYDLHTDRFILGFHSTKTLLDWVDNIQQLFGRETELYQQVKEVALKIRPELRDKVIFTGHSLGGGLAIVAALVTGSRAIVFNPPRIHQNTLAGLSTDDSRIARYRVKGDIASTKIPWPPSYVELGQETLLTTLPFASPHSIGQVLAGLRNEFSFHVFLIDAIVEILQPRVALDARQLRQSIFAIVRGDFVRNDLLPDLLGIDYRVESIDAGSAKVIVSVMYRKDQTSAELIEQESDWKRDDLPEEFREEFIRTRKTTLIYTIYKQG